MPLDRVVTLRLVQPWRRLSDTGGTHLPILMYHRITTEAEVGRPLHRRLCTSPRRFAEQMQWLADVGWHGVGVAEALAGPPAPAGHRRCAITFDDGFRDFLVEAAPTLASFGFRATVYLPTSFIADRRRTFNGHECLTWSEVRQLHRAGMEVGSHTASHSKLIDLSWREVRGELESSKNEIEAQLASRIEGFSYPYAYPQAHPTFVCALAAQLRELGYSHGVTTVIGRAQPTAGRFQLRRLPVSEADDRALFLAKLNGSYDWMSLPQALAKGARRFLPS